MFVPGLPNPQCDVADDANNRTRSPRSDGKSEGEMLSHRIFARKIRAGKNAINYGDTRGVDRVFTSEKTAAEKGYAHGAEIIRPGVED